MSGPKSYRHRYSRRALIASLGATSGVTPVAPPVPPATGGLCAQSIMTLCNVTAKEALQLVGIKISGQVGVTGGGNRGAINISDDGGQHFREYCAAGIDFVENGMQAADLVIGGDAGTVANVCVILYFT